MRQPKEEITKEESFIDVLTAAANKPYEQRKAIERQLASQAARQIDAITDLFKVADKPLRRFLVEMLSHAERSSRVSELLLHALFHDDDVKTRRRAAAAIGSSGDESMQKHLVQAFEKEPHRFVQASIILALGALGYNWSAQWKDRIGSQGPIAEAFRKATARSEVKSGEDRRKYKSVEQIVPPSAVYMLECYPGIEEFVKAETDMCGINGVNILGNGWLRIDLLKESEEKLRLLGKLRTVLAIYAIADEKIIDDSESIDDYIVNACKENGLNEEGKAGELSFRLDLPRMATRALYRKTVVKIAKRLTAECGLRNNPSDYALDIRLVNLNKTAFVLWRDTRWQSLRASEERKVLPASIHPTVAAALCIKSGINEKDVFCDPCCGAGTILAERLSYGHLKQAFGFDISSDAVKLSKQNLSRFLDKVKLKVADMRELPVKDESVNVVIANLPFGIRVGNRAGNFDLYKRFLLEARRILKRKGCLIAYTNDNSAFERACSELRWREIKHIATAQAGGIGVAIYEGIKP